MAKKTESIWKENIWNVPNLLTLIRLLLVPVYWVLFMQGHRHEALAVFLAASVTDILDGWIARKYHLITNVGKLLDPLADKIMVISVMLSHVLRGVIPWAVLAVLAAKEITMLVGGIILLREGVVVYAEKTGKIAQALTVSALVLCFFAEEFTALGFPAHLIVLAVAMILTLCALFFYTRQALQKHHAVKSGTAE